MELMLTPKQPALGSGAVAPAGGASQRAGRVIACGVLLSSTLLAGWTPDAQAARTRAPSTTPQRAEAAGGNPPSYDVFGKRYRVLASSNGYRESGVASWYGHPFDGRPTSSGEMYDMHEMTAAHRTLPIPTWVEVTNLTNGKRIVVKVNDRGPFVGKRVIDLSYAAATALDMVQDGTARVEVRALSGPPPPETTAGRRDDRARTTTSPKPAGGPEPTPSKSPPDSSRRAADGGSVASAGARSQPPAKRQRIAEPERPAERERPAEQARLFAEAGKFTKRDDAVQLVDNLKAQGVVNAFVVTEDGRRRSSHRVRVGPLPDAAEVESMNDWLRRLGAKHSRSVAMR
ncbi:MAG TPA: septal ring lytic transglycosylase RlpA family protein [Gammaproteobacteria bacterium]|nr:septal ring lytic transglycosylase RlpA family protein [Gammaproteobacteria bacterium]